MAKKLKTRAELKREISSLIKKVGAETDKAFARDDDVTTVETAVKLIELLNFQRMLSKPRRNKGRVR